MAKSRFRALGLIVTFGLVVFIALQFVRPRLDNPPVVADLLAPDDVKMVLKTSCYDCHSNETHLLWFDRIVPGYWLVVRDVKRGRMHMNFSNFGKLSPAQQKGFLYESANQIQAGYMPPANYLLLHPGTKVTPAQLDTLKKYLHPSDNITPATPEAIAAAESEYATWIARNAGPQLPSGVPSNETGVKDAPNGLAFLHGYQDWKSVSTTERYDNGTLRVILGNEIAQKAIASGNIHPWPDGSAFAKIAYKQQPDANGNIWTGEFIQVEFMLKDAAKYKSTEGWGFGRWRGDDLKPYGKNANFATECTSCHRPMEPNDFVYTMPLRADGTPPDAFNATAAIPAGLPYPVLDWNVITSSVDHAHGTMSTLYGNTAAMQRARTLPGSSYSLGAALALVTWNQQEDKHWFGGRIPTTVKTIEVVMVTNDDGGKTTYAYDSYTGSPLQKTTGTDATANQARIDAITGLKAAVMP